MSKKLKENPLMTDNKKIKKVGGLISSSDSDEDNIIKKFIIIVIILAVILGIAYGLAAFLNKKDSNYEFVPQEGKINYDTVSVGTILNRPYDDYYVLVYDSENSKANEYSSILSTYMSKSSDKDYIKIYYCDLNNMLNSSYYNVNNDNKSNPKATKVNEFDFGDLTFLHIKKGKITEYLEDYTIIQEKLK